LSNPTQDCTERQAWPPTGKDHSSTRTIFRANCDQKLQRAIAENRRQSIDQCLPPSLSTYTSIEEAYRSEESGAEGKQPRTKSEATRTTKRKYRRHPKPDEHAPERPASAYVIFSNSVRETLKGQDLTFTEIAKIVGERWQVLSPEAREACEKQAGQAKEKYYAELAEYKKTLDYAQYQEYLVEFKAKHSGTQNEKKRPKMDIEISKDVRGSSLEQRDRGTGKIASPVQVDAAYDDKRSDSTSPHNALQHTQRRASLSTRSFSGATSPRLNEHYSPMPASPVSMTTLKDSPYDFSYHISPHLQQKDKIPEYAPISQLKMNSHALTQSIGNASHTFDMSSRRTNQYRELPTRPSMEHSESSVPSLTRMDSTASSDSGGYRTMAHSRESLLPIDDLPKERRLLPQPIRSTLPPLSTIHRAQPLVTLPPPPPTSKSPDIVKGSFLALLRAGELAARESGHESGHDRPP